MADTQHPTVIELTGKMAQLGKRRLLQVQGSPDMAVSTMGLVGRSPSLHAPGSGSMDGPWRWLKNILLPRDGASGSEDESSIQAAARQEVVEIDRAMVGHLVDQGLIPRALEISLAEDDRGSHALFLTGIKKFRVHMKTEADGAADGVSSRFTDIKSRTYGRWAILMHEIAHTVLNDLPPAFCPGGMPKDVAETFNKWITHMGVGQGLPMADLFHECFADAYGMAMFLQTTKDDPESIIVAREVLAWRTENQKSAEDGYYKYIDGLKKNGGDPGLAGINHPHSTARVLDRLIASQDKLLEMSPERLLEHSLRVASDGMMDVLDPTRVDEQKRIIGQVTERVMIDSWAMPGLTRITWPLIGLAVACMAGRDPQDHVEKEWQGHPIYSVLMAAVPAVKAMVEHGSNMNGNTATPKREENDPGWFTEQMPGNIGGFLAGEIREAMANPGARCTAIRADLQKRFEASIQAACVELAECDKQYINDMAGVEQWMNSRRPEPQTQTSLLDRLNAIRKGKEQPGGAGPRFSVGAGARG